MSYWYISICCLLIACGPATKKKRIQRTFELANTKLEQAYYDEAISLYSQVIDKDPEVIDAFMNRGVAYFESGHFTLALADYNHVHFNYPEYPEVVFNLVYCHLELKRFRQAQEDIKELKSIYPDSALVDVIEGLFWSKQNYLSKAHLSFSTAIKKEEQNFDAWTNRGIVQLQMKNYDEAENDLLKALTINENAPEVLNPYSLLMTQKQRVEEADSIIDIALNIAPDHPYFLNNKGYIQMLLGEFDVADSYIMKSIKLDAGNAYAYKNLAELRIAQNKKDEAHMAILKTLELDSMAATVYDVMMSYNSKFTKDFDEGNIELLKNKYGYK
ncbi:MAG: tetratricopeptide repeat protein [Reichenbachiella sp.]